MPSMYGETNLDFKPGSDIFVLSDLAQYHKKISDMAREYTKKGQAVIVFFADAAMIQSFQDSPFKNPDWTVLTEESENKSSLFRKATISGNCTLSSASYGRGTDFVCRDQKVIDAGGVVVIQAFFSSSPSEEIQIKGRTARQGAKGRYFMVILRADLLPLFSDEDSLNNAIQSRDIYNTLNTLRTNSYETSVQTLQSKVSSALRVHNISIQLRHHLLESHSRSKAWELLLLINTEYLSLHSKPPPRYYIIMNLDESGSMSGNRWIQLLAAVKSFIVNRISKCTQAGYPCEDILSIICYADDAREVPGLMDIPLTNHVLNVIQRNLVQQGGTTDFARGIALSIRKFESVNLDGMIPVFLFMTDGECSTGDNEMVHLYQKFQQYDLQVFVIGFGSEAGQYKTRLQRLAQLGDGEYHHGDTGDVLQQEFERVATTLSSPVMHT